MAHLKVVPFADGAAAEDGNNLSFRVVVCVGHELAHEEHPVENRQVVITLREIEAVAPADSAG